MVGSTVPVTKRDSAGARQERYDRFVLCWGWGWVRLG